MANGVNCTLDGTVECSTQPDENMTTVAVPDESGPRCRWPAPTPDWPVAFAEWQWAWQLHIYLFPSLYFCLSVYIIAWFVTGCFESAGRIGQGYRGNRKTSRLNASLHGLVLTSCLSRCIFLFIDPYGTRHIFPCPLGPVLWSLGWPFITASISVLLLVLLETTKMSLAPPKFQRPSVLAAVIVPSLCFVLVADFLVAYNNSAAVALLLCQALFIVWGTLLCVGFLFVSWKMRHVVSNSRSCYTSEDVDARESNRLRRLNHIILSCSVIGLALTCTNLYAVISIYVVALRAGYTSPWRWLVFQTCQRLLEVSIVVMIVTAVVGTGKWSKNRVGLVQRSGDTRGGSAQPSVDVPV